MIPFILLSVFILHFKVLLASEMANYEKNDTKCHFTEIVSSSCKEEIMAGSLVAKHCSAVNVSTASF